MGAALSDAFGLFLRPQGANRTCKYPANFTDRICSEFFKTRRSHNVLGLGLMVQKGADRQFAKCGIITSIEDMLVPNSIDRLSHAVWTFWVEADDADKLPILVDSLFSRAGRPAHFFADAILQMR